MLRFLLLPLALLASPLAVPAQAQSFQWIDDRPVTVCPVAAGETQPPDFTGADCQEMPLGQVDPQGEHFWMRTSITPSDALRQGQSPLGFYISGKASSRVWINSHELESNGTPGVDRDREVAGLMDAVLYVPREILVPGENTVVLEMSGHHSLIHLHAPMHTLGMAQYTNPTLLILGAYWPSLITFGVFILALVFFGVVALREEKWEAPFLLSLLAAVAGWQLFAESARGLIYYAYSLHDYRLIGIATGAVLAGLLLLAWLLQRFSGLSALQRYLRLGGVVLACLVIVQLSPGFDAKAGYGFLTAALFATAWCGLWSWQKKPGALTYLAISGGFSLLLILFQGEFLDFYFFYAFAGLLLFLIQQQAAELVRTRREKRAEAVRADKLELALAQARQRTAPEQIQLVSSGRVDYLATDTITQFKGAGDYIEVHLEGGKTALYNGGLSALESDLPPTFLRVHRSHIVNTAFVSALERDASGVGRLLLSNGQEVPVSRRIMPKVRSALAEA